MTTLPQTTGSRLPRPAGASHGPGAGGLSMPGGAPAGATLTGGDIWRILRANAILIVAMLALSVASGYGIFTYLNNNFARYTTSGLIQVMAPTRVLPTGEEMTPLNYNPGGEIATQAVMLKNDALITTILQKPDSDIRRTTWFKGFNGDPIAAKANFLQNYQVDPIAGTNLLQVSFTCSVPKDCQTVVTEAVNTHLDELQRLVSDYEQTKTQQLNGLKMRYQMRLNELAVNLRDTGLRLNNDGSDTASGFGIKKAEMSAMVNQQITLQMERDRLHAELDIFVRQLKSGQMPLSVSVAIGQDTDLRESRTQADEASAQYAQVSNHLGSQNSAVKDALTTRDLYQTRYENLAAETRSRIVNEQLQQLNQSVSIADTNLEVVKAKVISLKSDLGDLANMTSQYLNWKDEERGLQSLVKDVQDQLEAAVNYRSVYGPVRVEWVSKPTEPQIKSFPLLGSVMGLSITLGLGLALGIAFLREMSDTSVRSPRDVYRVGQMTLLGMVSDESDDPQAAGARLPLMIFDAPHSLTAEQLRQVRTRLQHAASLDTTRSLMVTSPGPGDGKTTMACNLAAGLALNGRRILLVDANFRRPDVHKIFGAANDHGFSDVLGGTVTFDDMVHESQVPNLFIMTSGAKPINATEMFESQLLIDFIERALEEFDHVIFDSGPIMVVAEAVAMAPRVDGVVTVVRARGNSRGLLQRMRDLLRQVKAEHLGVILNAVRAQGGGYYGRNIKTYYEYQNVSPNSVNPPT